MRIGENIVQSPELMQFLEIFLAPSRQRLQAVEAQKDLLEVRSSVFTDLKTKLLTLKRLADDLSQTGALSAFGAKQAAISDENVLSVTAAGGAAATNHTFHVDQLARPHSVVSDRYTSTGTELGTTHAGVKNFQITVDGTAYDVSVTINASDTNDQVLAAVATAINDATGLPAGGSKMVDTDTTVRLSIASEDTGTANKMTFTDTDGLLAALGVTNATAATDTTGGYVYADLGGNELDAKLTVDGISIVRSSNTLSDVITGVTLDLHAAQLPTDADVTVDLTVDVETIQEKVQEFLDAYNETAQYLASKIEVDVGSLKRAELAGDFTYSNLLQRMRTSLAGSVSTTTDPNLFALSQIGITSNQNGTFTISNTDQFEDNVAASIAAVESLFNSTDGIGARMETMLDEYTKASGVINGSKEIVSTRIDNVDDRLDRLERLLDFERDRLIEKFGALRHSAQLSQDLTTMLNAIYGSMGL